MVAAFRWLGKALGALRSGRASWDDYRHWLNTDREVVKRINLLIDTIARDPFEGIGKPEPLKQRLSGHWSRRINDEHRIVYKVDGDRLKVAQLRYHY